MKYESQFIVASLKCYILYRVSVTAVLASVGPGEKMKCTTSYPGECDLMVRSPFTAHECTTSFSRMFFVTFVRGHALNNYCVIIVIKNCHAQ